MGAGVFGPEVFNLSLEAKTIAFYGCLGLATLCVLTGAVKELRAEAAAPVMPGHRRRMIAIAGMFVCGIGFLTFATIYFWPHRPASPAAPPAAATDAPPAHQKPWKHELEDLFASDFTDVGSTERTHEVTVTSQSQDVKLPLRLRFRLHLDFRSNTDYASIFIPNISDARISDQLYGLIKWMRDQILEWREDLRNTVIVGSRQPGVPYTEATDMRFSGRVFIYTLENFTVIQLGELSSWYRDAGIALQIRGSEYWHANKDR